MYALYATYYDATPPDRFRSDLDGKQFVIELRDGAGGLRGFSTLAIVDFELARQRRRALYSGDTIIDHRYWGEQALTRAFSRFAGALSASERGVPLHWFLISKGYRTYRFLSVFAAEYWPSPFAPTPPEAQACIDHLAHLKFGAAYRPELGVVRFPHSRGHLRPEWAAVGAGHRARPEVQFFLERNPRYHMGDELCCLTTLAAGNLRSFARRAFVEGLNDPASVGALPADRRRVAAVS